MADNLKEKTKPRIRHDDTCDLDYLLGPTNVLFENGILVAREDFDAWKKERTIVQHLNYLADENEVNNYDYAYALTTGSLRRRKGTADLVASARTEKRREKEVQKVKEIIVEEQKKEAVKRFLFSSAFITEAVTVCVGIGSAVMSLYHTRLFLMETKPVWVATMVALTFILFSATAFTAARYFFGTVGLTKLLGFAFLVAGTAVIGFSIFSTITVSFNQYTSATKIVAVEQDTVNTNRVLLELNRREQEELRDEITRLETEAEFWKDQSWRRYDTIQASIDTARTRWDDLRSAETELVRETPKAVLEHTTERETVYTFVARLFKVSVDFVQFLVYVIPAVFFDVVAPFALSVVLLLEDNRRKIVG